MGSVMHFWITLQRFLNWHQDAHVGSTSSKVSTWVSLMWAWGAHATNTSPVNI